MLDKMRGEIWNIIIRKARRRVADGLTGLTSSRDRQDSADQDSQILAGI